MAALNLGEEIDAATHKRNGTAVSLPSGDLTTHGVTRAANVETVPISLEKADIKVDELALCWIPVA